MTATSETGELSWSQRWTTWLRERTTVRSGREYWEGTFPAISEEIMKLDRNMRITPRFVADHDLFTLESISGMTEEAVAALRSEGFIHNGKWNAPVGPAALDFVDRHHLSELVSELTGVDVEEPQGATYIAYFEAGGHLDFHLDDFHYGEVNLIICLRHVVPDSTRNPSATVFIQSGGYRSCPLETGSFVLFDGAFTPHGRTPLAEGEEVILVSFSFKTKSRALWNVQDAPSAPPTRDEIEAAGTTIGAGAGNGN
ncbi:hypothetical protein [Planobispora takensis]|uniref:Uncharacterized protein n=1 Tax=Planobispora takensis TaxID=1367882 RepID=A0A8J3SRU7_9ACTN|nr:hypothetical protein [Planobispora takensis]GIH98189.1 hypothetical protein Pta02_01980 [Planobispora takensis]